MKVIKLRIDTVNRHEGNDCPLVDENNKPVDLDNFSNSLNQKLWEWNSEYDWFYGNWNKGITEKLQFEIQSLDLVRDLVEELPQDTKLVYYSELFKTELLLEN